MQVWAVLTTENDVLPAGPDVPRAIGEGAPGGVVGLLVNVVTAGNDADEVSGVVSQAGARVITARASGELSFPLVEVLAILVEAEWRDFRDNMTLNFGEYIVRGGQ